MPEGTAVLTNREKLEKATDSGQGQPRFRLDEAKS